MYDEYDVYEEEFDDFYDEELEAILEDYRKKQLMEHLIGPGVSFCVHVVMLLLLCFCVTASVQERPVEVEVVMEELKIKEPPPPPPDIKLEDIEPEENVATDVPAMETPDIPSETVDVALESFNDEAPETDDQMDMEAVLDVVPHPTPLKMAGLYGGRTNSGRAGAVRSYGGTRKGQNAVLRALKWLQKVQLENGSWENQPAHSGLALLCFLAYGATPLDETFGETVQKSMQWLCNNMPDGKQFGGRAYSHGIATYAIAEAYGMTHIPFLKDAMENGIDVIVKGQQPGGGYNYRYQKGERWDVSVAGWQYQALKAAYVSGTSNPGVYPAITKSKQFLKNTAYRNYQFAYSGGKWNHPNMTGVGVVCLQLLGDPNCKEVSGGMQTIMGKRLDGYRWENAPKCLYGWYYDTQAAFQYGMVNRGAWSQWQKKFEPTLVSNQHQEGYWLVKSGHGNGADLKGKVFSTTLCCLQLEVYYRYLPTFKFSKEFGEVVNGDIAEIDDTQLIIE